MSISKIEAAATAMVKYQFRNVDEIVRAVDDRAITDEVNAIERSRYSLNVRNAMGDLSIAGKSLQIAYAASIGTACGPDIAAIVSKYATFLNDSSFVCDSFLSGCMKMMQNYVQAIEWIQLEDADSSIECLNNCAAEANKMATIAGAVSKKAEELMNLAHAAFVKASSEKTHTAERISEVKKLMADFEKTRDGMSAKTRGLEDQINEQKKRQLQIAKDLAASKSHNLIMSVIRFAWTPISKSLSSENVPEAFRSMSKRVGELNAEMRTLRKELALEKIKLQRAEIGKQEEVSNAITLKIEEMQLDLVAKEEELKECQSFFDRLGKQAETEVESLEASKEKAQQKLEEMEQDQLNAKVALAESIAKLRNTSIEKGSLDRTVRPLEITVRSIVQVKSILDTSRVYWLAVEAHCNQLKDNQTSMKFLQKNMFDRYARAISNSALECLALSNMSRKSAIIMGRVTGNMKKVLEHLPTTDEAEALIVQVSDEVMDDIEDKKGE